MCTLEQNGVIDSADRADFPRLQITFQKGLMSRDGLVGDRRQAEPALRSGCVQFEERRPDVRHPIIEIGQRGLFENADALARTIADDRPRVIDQVSDEAGIKFARSSMN